VINIVSDICQIHGISFSKAEPLSGGDINQVYKVTSGNEAYVFKLNSLKPFEDMFQVEAMSLDILRETNSFLIPEVIAEGKYRAHKYLILEYLHSENTTNAEAFAQALAKLHKTTSDGFGLDFDNYIGALPQKNNRTYNTASQFFINLRLEPQFKMASQKGYAFKNLEALYKVVEDVVPNEPSSLIHGDLWSGNYMFAEQRPVLIDPAIAFAPREMDISMMKLFGGFSPEIFNVYHEAFPLSTGWEDRIRLWQLYYLLVHLNIFGQSYYGSVERIVKTYSP